MIAWMWAKVSGYAAAVGAGLALVTAIYLKGKSDQKQKAKIDDLTAANEIRKAGADARAGVDPRGVSDDGWRRD
jgi:hypothetical protein